ncbi:Mbeg1-like protein [Pseudoflavonifractor sp. 60]|uniref:Mbeg1-like protein n=1 Tax=Pseudoflavonifractor sp. 60 TaxID=2304576 RepID=UPI00325B4FCC
MLDYLAWRGDLSLVQVPFCPVDALILSALSYIHFDGLVPAGRQQAVPLGETALRYLSLPPERRGRCRCDEDLKLLQALAEAPRFAPMVLCRYIDRFVPQEETQFAALTVLPGDGSACLAFRGTDGTLVGWKEDFNLSFLDVVPAQLEAAEYIQSIAAGFSGPLRLAGHSKGGNLAAAGASLCAAKIRDRIKDIYSFDSPGFTPYLLSQPGYHELLTRIRSFVPKSSVVGLLLAHEETHTVILSDQEGLFQHDLYSWQVLGADFIQLEEVDADSRIIDRTLKSWLASLTREQREAAADTLYQLLSSGDAKTVQQALEPKHLAAILGSIKSTDPKDLLTLGSSLAGLVGAALRALS